MSKHNSKCFLHDVRIEVVENIFAAKLTLGSSQRRFCIDMQNFDGLDCLVKQPANGMAS